MPTHTIPNGTRIRVGRYLYIVNRCRFAGEEEHRVTCVSLVPVGDGDTACAAMPSAEGALGYAYTHGGETFRAACDRASRIESERRGAHLA